MNKKKHQSRLTLPISRTPSLEDHVTLKKRYDFLSAMAMATKFTEKDGSETLIIPILL